MKKDEAKERVDEIISLIYRSLLAAIENNFFEDKKKEIIYKMIADFCDQRFEGIEPTLLTDKEASNFYKTNHTH